MEGAGESAGGPTRRHERALMRRHGGPVAGVDEAGRGPWAGPVVAAAVVFEVGRIPPRGLNDSKLIAEEEREALYEKIVARAHVGVGIADVARIDRDNILQATMWAMAQACAALPDRPAAALVDGNRCPGLSCPAEALVSGDRLAVCVAAASIVAKVTRDRMMRELAEAHPVYFWERNKGYGTRQHAEALTMHGVTEHHRRSWKPVQAVLSGMEIAAEALRAPQKD